MLRKVSAFVRHFSPTPLHYAPGRTRVPLDDQRPSPAATRSSCGRHASAPSAPLRSTAQNVGPRHILNSSLCIPNSAFKSHLPASNSLRSGVVMRDRPSATTFRYLHVWALGLADPFSKISGCYLQYPPRSGARRVPPATGPRRLLTFNASAGPGLSKITPSYLSKTLRSLSCWLLPTPAPDSHHAKLLRHLSRQPPHFPEKDL